MALCCLASIIPPTRQGAPARALATRHLRRAQANFAKKYQALAHLRDTSTPIGAYDTNVTWGTGTPRKGAGPLPALLLAQGPLPPTTPCLPMGGSEERRPCSRNKKARKRNQRTRTGRQQGSWGRCTSRGSSSASEGSYSSSPFLAHRIISPPFPRTACCWRSPRCSG